MEAEQILTWYSGMHMVQENAPDIFDADAQLMLRFKRGDAEAFDQLFARHTHAMVNFAFRFVIKYHFSFIQNLR